MEQWGPIFGGGNGPQSDPDTRQTHGFDTALDRFWDRLAQAAQRLLVLDYDGTIAPFREQRDQAYPDPGVAEAINHVVRNGQTRVAIVSGRAVGDLVPLVAGFLDPIPELWGSHGAERRTPEGRCETAILQEPARRCLEHAGDWVRARGLAARCEVKPASVAFHWRGSDEAQVKRLRDAARSAWEPLTTGGHVFLQEFDGGIELRAAGWDKGHAIRQLLRETGPGAAIAYAGDDQTDEDAFAALGAHGLKVLVRERSRDSLADIWLKPPEELIEFLKKWRHVLEGPRS